jgi:hypothetical protein
MRIQPGGEVTSSLTQTCRKAITLMLAVVTVPLGLAAAVLLVKAALDCL